MKPSTSNRAQEVFNEQFGNRPCDRCGTTTQAKPSGHNEFTCICGFKTLILLKGNAT